MQSCLVRTSLPATVRLEAGNGQLPCLRVSNGLAEAEIYLHGAHITSWTPKGQAPVLWVSRESAFEAAKPIRGGVPICFPWFGGHATEKAAPAHGYARLADWSLIDAKDDASQGTTLTFGLSSEGRDWPFWPHRFDAAFHVTVGTTLSMSLEVHNPGTAAITFEEALHTYFAVQYVREIEIAGLERTDYLDKVDGMARKNQGPDPIRFTAETDRIYLDTRARCVIRDPGRRRRIAVAKTGSNTTVVWNPWIEKARAMPDFGDLEWPEMVCVETCNVNAFAVSLAPGARHVMSAAVRVDVA